MQLSKDQESAVSTIIDWYNSFERSPFITLGGYAGTGKTTVVAEIRRRLPESLQVAYCAYTGKATSILRHKLFSSNVLNPNDVVGTIHSLIYEPIMNGDEIIGWRKKNSIEITYNLFIIDESSMVSKDMFDDLLSYGRPIICVGDHGQLPPISSDGFNLMSNPDVKLETIHRYCDNSEESPLIKLSMMARIDGDIPFGEHGDGVLKVYPNDKRITPFVKMMGDFSNSFCVVGFNNTRVKMNKKFRDYLHRADCPLIGDRVICLRNNKNAVDIPIYNGMIGTITDKFSVNNCYEMNVKFDDETELYKGYVSRKTFNNEKGVPQTLEYIYKSDIIRWKQEKTCSDFYSINNRIIKQKEKIALDNFDYAYAITCHKAQGSEMENVMVIEQKCAYWSDGDMWRRWLYTAVTRSKKNLMIVSQGN